MIFRFFVFVLVLISFAKSFALTAEQVVQSSLKHYPQVMQALQSVEQAENQVKEARGAFDAKLKGEVDTRTQGYYDGDYYKASIEKAFPFLNSKVYGGHRIGYDQFPVYEGKMETLDRGEVFIGYSFSLLRNAMIDMNRYNLRYKKQDAKQSQIQLKEAKITVQTLALKAYWMWFIKGHELKVYRDLLELAEVRASQIDRRIKVGDLAAIYSVENKQYINKRKAEVAKKAFEFREASLYLSLFYRNEKAEPQLPETAELPQLDQKELSSVIDSSAVVTRAFNNNLELALLQSQSEQAQLDVDLGHNEILPKVDVNFEWNQDQGIGPQNLTQDENRIMLKLEVPLQYRKGLGKKRAGKAKLENIGYKAKLVREKLKVSVDVLLSKLNTLSEVFSLTKNQVQFAGELAVAEQKKFKRGASDLILLNIREEAFAEARIKNLTSLLDYHFVDAEVKRIQVDLIR